MKKQTVQLKVAQPCGEDWDQMQPVSGGRFCQQCTRTLIDFSNMSDLQIIRLLRQKDKPVCGRFANTQLNRPLLPANSPGRVQFAPVLAGILLLGSPVTSFAQRENPLQTQLPVPIAPTDTISRTIYGSITDYNMQHPVAYASCHIKETDIFFTTDSLGYFTLQLPENLIKEKLTVHILHLDYPDQDVNFRPIVGLQGGNVLRLMEIGTTIPMPESVNRYTLGFVIKD